MLCEQRMRDKIALTLCTKSRSAACPQSQTGLSKRHTDQVFAIHLLPCYLKEMPPRGLGLVCNIISHSPSTLKGLYVCFLSLMMRAKVMGQAGALGNQTRLGGICPSQPQRDWLGSGTPGALSVKWLFSFPFDQAVHGIFGRTRSDLSCTCVFIYSSKAELKH